MKTADLTARHAPTRTIRLTDERVQTLIDGLDSANNRAAIPAGCHLFPYRNPLKLGLVDSSGNPTACDVIGHSISERCICFLHGGFINNGTACAIQLKTASGSIVRETGRIFSNNHIDGNVHEIVVEFSHTIEVVLFSQAAMRIRMLYAEDEPTSVLLLKHHLSTYDVALDHCDNGETAVQMAQENQYDLILLDLDMPKMGGMEAMKTLREAGYFGPIVSMTGLTSDGIERECLEAGFDYYITKPYSRDDIAGIVTMAMVDPLYSSLAQEPGMSEIIDAFVAELAKQIRTIREALSNDERKAIESVVRSLKSLGSACGFSPITDAASRVESTLIPEAPLDSVRSDILSLMRLCHRARSNPQVPPKPS